MLFSPTHRGTPGRRDARCRGINRLPSPALRDVCRIGGSRCRERGCLERASSMVARLYPRNRRPHARDSPHVWRPDTHRPRLHAIESCNGLRYKKARCPRAPRPEQLSTSACRRDRPRDVRRACRRRSCHDCRGRHCDRSACRHRSHRDRHDRHDHTRPRHSCARYRAWRDR